MTRCGFARALAIALVAGALIGVLIGTRVGSTPPPVVTAGSRG